MINVVLVLSIIVLSFIVARLFSPIIIAVVLAAYIAVLGLSIFIFKKIKHEEDREDDPVWRGGE